VAFEQPFRRLAERDGDAAVAGREKPPGTLPENPHRADVYTKLSGNNYLIFTRSNFLTIR
jgi:hypothetical protein